MCEVWALFLYRSSVTFTCGVFMVRREWIMLYACLHIIHTLIIILHQELCKSLNAVILGVGGVSYM